MSPLWFYGVILAGLTFLVFLLAFGNRFQKSQVAQDAPAIKSKAVIHFADGVDNGVFEPVGYKQLDDLGKTEIIMKNPYRARLVKTVYPHQVRAKNSLKAVFGTDPLVAEIDLLSPFNLKPDGSDARVLQEMESQAVSNLVTAGQEKEKATLLSSNLEKEREQAVREIEAFSKTQQQKIMGMGFGSDRK